MGRQGSGYTANQPLEGVGESDLVAGCSEAAAIGGRDPEDRTRLNSR